MAGRNEFIPRRMRSAAAAREAAEKISPRLRSARQAMTRRPHVRAVTRCAQAHSSCICTPRLHKKHSLNHLISLPTHLLGRRAHSGVLAHVLGRRCLDCALGDGLDLRRRQCRRCRGCRAAGNKQRHHCTCNGTEGCAQQRRGEVLGRHGTARKSAHGPPRTVFGNFFFFFFFL